MPAFCYDRPAFPTGGVPVSELDRQFEQLGDSVSQIIALLHESGDGFWIPYLERGLAQVRQNRLSGATFILGCYGGEETFSDLVIGRRFEDKDPLVFRNLNSRLSELRSRAFEDANAITSRRAW
jgi:hypothetical protein